MAEAKSKGHAGPQGRRVPGRMTNTAEEGELCIYTGHSIGRFSNSTMRYDSHQACTRCVAGAREGRISFNIDTLLKKERKRALKFWSQVEIGAPDECWDWKGCINDRTGQPQFAWRRHRISSSTQHHPQRVAMWFTWGDLGYTTVKTTCGNRYCCNPFHLIPQGIGVFVDDDSYLESFDMAIEIHTLKQRVQEYLIEEMMKEQQKLADANEIDHHNMLMFGEGNFAERLEAVTNDILKGNHISQTEPDDPSMFKRPDDNGEESSDKPT